MIEVHRTSPVEISITMEPYDANWLIRKLIVCELDHRKRVRELAEVTDQGDLAMSHYSEANKCRSLINSLKAAVARSQAA